MNRGTYSGLSPSPNHPSFSVSIILLLHVCYCSHCTYSQYCVETHTVKSQRPWRRQRSTQFYLNNGREFTGPYSHGVSLLMFQRTQPPLILNSGSHIVLFLSPLAEELGMYSLPEPPTTYAPLEHSILPHVQKFWLPGLCKWLCMDPFACFLEVQEFKL